MNNTFWHIMNNHLLMRLATQNSGGNVPASEESIMILGGVLLLLVLLLIAFCVYLWWDTRPKTIDVYRDYEKRKPNQPHVAEDLPQEPQEPLRSTLTMSTALSIAGMMAYAMKEAGMLKALLSTDIENDRSTSDHNSNNKKKGQ